MKRFKNDWLFYLIMGIILLVFGILIVIPQIPLHDKMIDIVKYIAGALLLVYALIVLFPMCRRKTCKIVVVYRWIELVLIVLVAISMFINIKELDFNISKCLAIPLYAYGFVEIIRGYYSQGDVQVITDKGQQVYDRLAKYFNIALITLGTFVFVKEPLKEEQVVYAIGIILIIAALVCGYFAKKYKPSLTEEQILAKEQRKIERKAKDPEEKEILETINETKKEE